MPEDNGGKHPYSKWREKFRIASFKGIRFFVESHELETGRNVVVPEAPTHPPPDTQDLGKSRERYSITAFIVSPDGDYMTHRDALLLVLKESPGPGKLVHPYFGEKWVSCVPPVRVRESRDRGGYARFDLTFVEEPISPYTKMTPDLDAQVTDATGELDTESNESWIDKAKEYIADLSEEIQDQLTVDPDDLAKGVKQVKGFFNVMYDAVATLYDAVDNNLVTQLLDSIHQIDNEIASVINKPNDLAMLVQTKVNEISNLIPGSGTFAALNVTLQLLGWDEDSAGFPYIPPTTPENKLEQAARDATFQLVHNSLVSAAAKLAISADYESYQQTDQVREEISKTFSEISERAGDLGYDKEVVALEKVRTLTSRSLSRKAGALPKIVQHQVGPISTNVLQLAYDLYEDMDRIDEIIDRNPIIENPAFVPAGAILEVLES